MRNETNTKEIETLKNKDMKNKEMKNEPTSHCQSKIMSSLSVRAEKIMEKKLRAFFKSTSPRHPVFPHGLVLHIREAAEPTISLDIVTHVLEVQGPDIQNGLITHKHLDEEFTSLHGI